MPMWWQHMYAVQDGMDGAHCKISLRARGEASDTTPITQMYGGGGHALASSCLVSWSEWDVWVQLAHGHVAIAGDKV
jgi:nanoRNase/pAp phosphatase (c-di-AMP/oligoRNAs hydrolase)